MKHRNTNQDEDDSPMQQGGRLETVCRGEEEDEEEGCRETSPVGTRQRLSGAAAETLVSGQDSSAQEGEPTRRARSNTRIPPTDFR